MNLCIIYNFAAHYRQGIFKRIDKEFNCTWFFGKSNSDIKRMDYSFFFFFVKELDCVVIKGLCWQKGVLSLLRKREYTKYLILAQTKDISTWVFAILARLFYPRKRVFFWSHGYYGKESWLERFIKRVLFSLPKGGTFLYGNYARDLMINDGLDANKLYVIHNSLDYECQLEIRRTLHQSAIFSSYFGNFNQTIVFVGRLTSIKRLDILIKSLKRCHQLGKLYNLVLIGDGEMKEELVSLSSLLELKDHIWFYGPCYDEKVLGEFIYNADLCVSPGNVGLTAMHSLVYGTPVITHNDFTHQMPEFEAIIPKITGDYFVDGSVPSLTEVIIAWLSSNSNNRESIRQACFKEIDTNWTPSFQLSVLCRHIKNE